MKRLTFTLSLAVAIFFFSCNNKSVDRNQTVNSILGDISFISKFGHKPDKATDNILRIKTHLAYVENLL